MFLRTLERYRGRLLVACSGGADSTCLAHVAMQRAKSENVELPTLIYINHGLREEAVDEGQRVVVLAKRFGAQALVERVTLDEGASIERAARDARYARLEAIARELEIDWVLLGHTASDQAETVFMRIMRGTGLVGLAGMPKERQQYARPLLGLRRQDTENYCKEHKLPFVEDPMNRDSKFTRARVRHHWLPQLRQENPRIDESLCRIAASARDHRAVLEWAASRVLSDMQAPGGLQVGPSWRDIPDELAVRALILDAARHGVDGLENSHLLELMKLVRRNTAGSVQLAVPGGLAQRDYDLLKWNPRTEDELVVTVGPDYEARRWRAGDRMRPERLKGKSSKLSDLFAAAKIPQDQRRLAWVVERKLDQEIVWAQHIGHAHGSKIDLSLTVAS